MGMNIEEEKEFQKHCDALQAIIEKTKAPLEGNCVYYHQSLTAAPELKNKQINLFRVGKTVKTNLMEIGFNAGHSALLFLLSAPPGTKMVFFDICEHVYVLPCFEYLRSSFPHVDMDLQVGDSRMSIQRWMRDNPNTKFDVVHVDGGHDHNAVQSDTTAAAALCRAGGIIIMDDTNNYVINGFADELVKQNLATEMQLLPTYLYQHRIFERSIYST
jgi:predicted O-methyltransferase YrrM